jgi:hypothetical protein
MATCTLAHAPVQRPTWGLQHDPSPARPTISGLGAFARASGIGGASEGGSCPGRTGIITIVQPNERTNAGFPARGRAVRDQAVREGDQAYGAVECAMA